MIKQLKGILGSATKALEILYVLEGIKPVARQGFYESELPAIKQFCKQHNLHIELSPYKVILADAKYPGQYSNKGIKVKNDDPRRGMYFAYISKHETKAIQANCLELNNRHKELGLALGYPECCSDFFRRYEPGCSKTDSNYSPLTLRNSKGRIFPFQNNILKQNQDITLLNHFPCNLACQESVKLANKHLDIIKKHDRNLANNMIKQLKCELKIGTRLVRFI